MHRSSTRSSRCRWSDRSNRSREVRSNDSSDTSSEHPSVKPRNHETISIAREERFREFFCSPFRNLSSFLGRTQIPLGERIDERLNLIRPIALFRSSQRRQIRQKPILSLKKKTPPSAPSPHIQFKEKRERHTSNRDTDKSDYPQLSLRPIHSSPILSVGVDRVHRSRN